MQLVIQLIVMTLKVIFWLELGINWWVAAENLAVLPRLLFMSNSSCIQITAPILHLSYMIRIAWLKYMMH
jgi:hypothetical protein